MISKAATKSALDSVSPLAPDTLHDRARIVDRLAAGIVCAVSIGNAFAHWLLATTRYLERASRLIQHNPLVGGFGIKAPKQAEPLHQHEVGFIAGSVLMQDHTLSVIQGIQQLTKPLAVATTL